jgi:hypothetical protein
MGCGFKTEQETHMISTTAAITSPNFDITHGGPGTAPLGTRSELQLVREELADLCQQMEWLRGWWEEYGDVVRGVDRTAAARVHDHFIDGACLSRRIARAAGIAIDVDYIASFDWTAPSNRPTEGDTGASAVFEYLGGNLGLYADVTIHARTPVGEIDLSLEQALNRIDEFAEPGQNRILLALPHDFHMPEQRAPYRPGDNSTGEA